MRLEEILKCDHSNESYWAVRTVSCDTVNCAVQGGSNFCVWKKSLCVTIQMNATEQYFPVVLFIMLYKVVLTLSLWVKYESVTIQMKATEQYFPVVLFIMLYKVVSRLDPTKSVTIQRKAILTVALFVMQFSVALSLKRSGPWMKS